MVQPQGLMMVSTKGAEHKMLAFMTWDCRGMEGSAFISGKRVAGLWPRGSVQRQ